MADLEKPGSFYLGRAQSAPGGEPDGEPLLYDARHLTTHALCVGMTGSGKTGLGIGLLEEAALDGVPAIVVDPKGDMANLLLAFPELRPEDFAPWVDPDEATRLGIAPDELARRTAASWREGLAQWGQDGARIARLRAAADFAVYTPGSTAARPLRVLRSLAAPPPALRADVEALNERVTGSVSGLLALLGIDADPIQSREAILLANIVQRAWNEGRDLDLAELIRAIQDPPFERLGVLAVDAFFPAKERFQLALALNNLLASPGFAAWLEGEPLDVARLLWTADGRPRVSILSIAHLSETERMFFVTLLLGEVLAWVRTQPGTTSLRALLYMDEIFGFFPPTREPPSKRPMLTLLKQARAYGLGIVLATQNPVDLDYKGLSNAGTWFLGRLQTERDKLRVLDGLEGALRGAGRAFDRAELEAILSGLGKRVFLMHDVHAERPQLFRTRWALSYLHGPLSRAQLRRLAGAAPAEAPGAQASAAGAQASATAAQPASPGAQAAAPAPSPAASVAPSPAPAAPAAGKDATASAGTARPVLDPAIEERFARASAPLAAGETRLYRPMLHAHARLHHKSASPRVDAWRELDVLVPLGAEASEPPWDEAEVASGAAVPPTQDEPDAGARFDALPAEAARPERWSRWQKALLAHLYRTQPLVLYECAAVELVSEPGEAEANFRLRFEHALAARREQEAAALRERAEARLERAREAVRKARERVGVQEEQLGQKKREGWIAVGSSLLGALFSKKRASAANVGRASSAARAMGRSAREQADVERAERDLKAAEEALAALEQDLARDVAALEERFRPAGLALEERAVAPRKSDLELSGPCLLWVPWTLAPGGVARRALAR